MPEARECGQSFPSGDRRHGTNMREGRSLDECISGYWISWWLAWTDLIRSMTK